MSLRIMVAPPQDGTLREPSAVERLFTEKAGFYHRFFIDFLRYGAGLEALFSQNRYLRFGVKVLDAGCGTGILTRNLHAIARRSNMHGVIFHGFDLTPAMLDLFTRWMAEHGVENIELRRANVLHAEELPASWRDYDLIVSSAMLEYLPKGELVGALRNLNRLLARDGILVVCISRQNLLMRWLIGVWWKANLYERAELEQIFDDAGFTVRFRHFPFPYSHVNLWGHVIEARKAP